MHEDGVRRSATGCWYMWTRIIHPVGAAYVCVADRFGHVVHDVRAVSSRSPVLPQRHVDGGGVFDGGGQEASGARICMHQCISSARGEERGGCKCEFGCGLHRPCDKNNCKGTPNARRGNSFMSTTSPDTHVRTQKRRERHNSSEAIRCSGCVLARVCR